LDRDNSRRMKKLADLENEKLEKESLENDFGEREWRLRRCRVQK